MVVKVSDSWYECGICKSKYVKWREAEKCERSHKVRQPDIGDI